MGVDHLRGLAKSGGIYVNGAQAFDLSMGLANTNGPIFIRLGKSEHYYLEASSSLPLE